jgi:hypothetical protein
MALTTIFDKLARKGKWDGSYSPTESVTKWIPHKIKRNGKRVSKIIDKLIKDGYLLIKKKGMAISLNPEIKREILSWMDKYL